MNAKPIRPVETEVLDSLLAVHPNFAGDGIVWTPPDFDPPDFLGMTTNGSRIGLELTEWLDAEQSRKWFPRMDNEGYLTLAIASDTHPKPKHFQRVLLNLKQNAHLTQAVASQFGEEFYNLIQAVDAAESEELSKPRRVIISSEFKEYPVLRKYLATLDLLPDPGIPTMKQWRSHWVIFPVKFLPHAPELALKTLLERITAKTKKYANICQEKNLSELILLVHYGIRGFMQNTIWANEIDVNKMSEEARRLLHASPGSFGRAFLYLRFNEGRLIRLK